MKHIKKFDELNEGLLDIFKKSDKNLEYLNKELSPFGLEAFVRKDGDDTIYDIHKGSLHSPLFNITIFNDGLIIVSSNTYHIFGSTTTTIKTKVKSLESSVKLIKEEFNKIEMEKNKINDEMKDKSRSFDKTYNEGKKG